MITKQLIKEVLHAECINPYLKLIEPFVEYTVVHYAKVSGQSNYTTRNINIYELAHRCKNWALTKGYVLSSSSYNGFGFCEIKQITEERLVSIPWCDQDYNTESEAVFKACEYILNIGDKND